MRQKQTGCEGRLAAFTANRNDAAASAVWVIVNFTDRIALPVHELDRLTDQRTLWHATCAFDPANDLRAKGEARRPECPNHFSILDLNIGGVLSTPPNAGPQHRDSVVPFCFSHA